MQMEMGLAHFWAQGDLVTHVVALVLMVLSLASWYVMLSKAIGVMQAKRTHAQALQAFWGALGCAGFAF